MAKRSQETQARFEQQRSIQETLEQIRERGEKRSAEIMDRAEGNSELARVGKEKLQQEQRQFQENLLTELKRHNDLMERLSQLV